MALSNDIVSLFVKATNDRDKKSKESTAYGTVKIQGDRTYVKIDGSDQLTPVSTTTNMVDGERVTVRIKDHTATATGNISSPAARTEEVEEVAGAFTKFVDELYVQDLKAVNADITNLEVAHGEFKELVVEDLEAKKASIEQLEADNANIQNAVIKDLTAEDGTIENLNTKYARIDFANIGEAAFEYFYSQSGLIENIVVGGGSITGTLVGVTIKGDMIEGKTVVADKLVIKGPDGLYYKLNTKGLAAGSYADGYVKMDTTIDPVEGELVEDAFTTDGRQVYRYELDGETRYYTIVSDESGDVYYDVLVEANSIKLEQTEYNSLNGSIITAKTITAEQISVHDLVAFDAKIAGFSITGKTDTEPGAIYSDVKDLDGNIMRGIYFDTDGQMDIGDATNYIRYVRNDDGTYSLSISAKDISYSLNGSQHSISELGRIGEYVEIGTYEGEPCILLGETDSDFKLIITNTRIRFMEGTDSPAYITNKTLHINKAVIEDEMRLGQFVWKIRTNGNMGLVWETLVNEAGEVIE